METLIIKYGSILILSLRIMIVCGLFLFLREYMRHKAKTKEIRLVHHIVIAFVVALGVMLTQSIVFRGFILSPLSLDDMQVFLISLTNTLITFILMVFAYREYHELLRRVK